MWPSPSVHTRAFALNPGALADVPAEPVEAPLRSPQSIGLAAGDWGSFGNPGDVAGDQRGILSGRWSSPARRCLRLEILGNARLISSSQRIGPTPSSRSRLIDVAPSGRRELHRPGILEPIPSRRPGSAKGPGAA